MWNTIVTLYIDDSSIRLLTMKGQRIKKWGYLKLEPGLVVDTVVVQESEVAFRIRQLLKSQKVRAKKVILGHSGLHSLTRPATLPKLPKSMLHEAVVREARRVLPVPLDQLYLSWHSIPGRKEKIQIFMAAIPRKTADSLVRTLRKAGLEPSRMAIKPLALTRTLTASDAILIDVQPSEFDIVVLADRITQPIRTVAFSDQELSWEQKMDTIADDLNRTIKFFNANNSDKLLDPAVPIYVCGELTGKAEIHNALSETSGHPVLDLSPIIKSPRQIDLSYYTVNIAMAMNAINPVREPAFPVANLNVLPEPYQPKPISLTKVTGIPGGIAIAGFVIPLIMMIQNTSTNITSMQNQLIIANQVINQKTAQSLALKKNISELGNQVSAAQKVYDSFRKSVDTIKNGQEIIKGDLSIALNSLLPDVTISSITESGNILSIKGQAPNEDEVYEYAQAILQYARTIDLSERFSESNVTSLVVISPPGNSRQIENQSQNKKRGIIQFVLTFKRGA
jgi:type IV pilus assembly protein PilM